jgi:hypothetical protein
VADDKKTAPADDKKAETTKEPTHIRYVGHPSQDENSTCTVFGKAFQRGKWVPLANLNGGNPEKKALEPGQLEKLLGNPAFQLGDGKDAPIPGSSEDDGLPVEEA